MGESRGAFAAAMLTVGLTVLLTLGISGARPRISNMDVTLTGVFVAATAATAVGAWLFVSIARASARLRQRVTSLARLQAEAWGHVQALLGEQDPARIPSLVAEYQKWDSATELWLRTNCPDCVVHYGLPLAMNVSAEKMLTDAAKPASYANTRSVRLGEIIEKITRYPS